jgi:2-polyprenyl-6-hydroxyphenyl methylase/3-demethylubiquinone-9 3-methyltransferase
VRRPESGQDFREGNGGGSVSARSEESEANGAQGEASSRRFAFGKNWLKFLRRLNEERIELARSSLQEMLGVETLGGASFLDVGSGSGLFSLAAVRMGADRVDSFDYDEASVACTEELKRRFFADRAGWSIQRGDCLDRNFMARFGLYDVVYSWGVLHHTGAMWDALSNVVGKVKPGGQLYLAIYNDQGWQSRFWWNVKRIYCSGPVRRTLVVGVFFPLLGGIGLVSDLLNRRNPIARYRKPRARGMSTFRDWFDWLGGYPFEVAKPEEIVTFCLGEGFALSRMSTCGGGWGCNEFVFHRDADG